MNNLDDLIYEMPRLITFIDPDTIEKYKMQNQIKALNNFIEDQEWFEDKKE